MPFNLIDVNAGGSIVNSPEGTPLVFEDGRAAAAAAASLAAETGGRYQPRRVAMDDNVWKQREQARFDSGTYRRPLFASEDWFRECTETADHYLHVSVENPANVAFTANAENGHADRQTSMRVGRYLEQFFPNLERSYRERLTREHTVEFVEQRVQFTQDADRIAWIYQNGPHSCMAYALNAGNFAPGLPVHPTAVYAGPDLAIAYLMSEGDDTRVAARAVCWPDRQRFGRVYGDQRLHSLLLRQGFEQNGDFEGARLRRHSYMYRGAEVIVAPYFDSADYFADAGDHLVVSRSGGLAVKSTNGTAYRQNTVACACCGVQSRENMTVIVNVDFNATERRTIQQRWCHSCHETRRNEITRSSRYGSYALRSAGTMQSGVFWFTADWEREAGIREEQARLHQIALEARQRAEAEEAARQERRIAARNARRARQLEVQATNIEGYFHCPVLDREVRWEHGVDVRSLIDGRVVSQRWSQEAASTRAARCRINRHLYRIEDTVWFDGVRMNRNTAITRGWSAAANGEIEMLIRVVDENVNA
jgi:hypothetical protein